MESEDMPLQTPASLADSPEKSTEQITLCMCGSSRAQRTCEHDFKGWREFADGNGGETVCTKCGLGAMAHSLSLDW